MLKKRPERAELVVQEAPVLMGRGHGGDGRRTVGLADAGDLTGHEVQGLVPGDALVLVLAAQLRMPLPVRVEVLALQRVLDAVRVDARPLGHLVALQGGLARRRELPAARLDRPGRSVVLIEDDGPHPLDDAVLDVHPHRPADRALDEDLLLAHGTTTSRASRRLSVACEVVCSLVRIHPSPIAGPGRRCRPSEAPMADASGPLIGVCPSSAGGGVRPPVRAVRSGPHGARWGPGARASGRSELDELDEDRVLDRDFGHGLQAPVVRVDCVRPDDVRRAVRDQQERAGGRRASSPASRPWDPHTGSARPVRPS